MKKVVYITGCLGFIGSYITRACLQKGWYVKGVDKMTYAANRTLLKEFREYNNFTFVKKLPWIIAERIGTKSKATTVGRYSK